MAYASDGLDVRREFYDCGFGGEPNCSREGPPSEPSDRILGLLQSRRSADDSDDSYRCSVAAKRLVMQAKTMSPKNTRSLRALDWLNFSMADVLTGLGPFLAIYLTASR